MVSGIRKNPKIHFSLWDSGFAHLRQRPCYLLILIFSVMQNQKKNTQSPVQTKNEQKFSNCIVGRVLKNKSILDSANAEIREAYLDKDKDEIIDDLISDFQEKFNYENFISELGLSDIFESWKTFNMIREEVYNG